MNIILFDKKELGGILPYNDARARHLRDILRVQKGDFFRAGILDSVLGEAQLHEETAEGWKWRFFSLKESPPLHPLHLLLGCPRPPVARRLLRDMTALGLQEILVCSTDLNEKNYLSSKLWRENQWHSALIEGAMQGGSTFLPRIKKSLSLEQALSTLPSQAHLVGLDNGSRSQEFHHLQNRSGRTVLAVGPERGWSDRERLLLEAKGFLLLHLGERILRTETACALGCGLLLKGMGFF